MKKKQRPELDQEYVPNAAARARERDRARLERFRAAADEREARIRQYAIEEARRQAQPIEDRETLSCAVADLAHALGLKRKR